MRVLTTILCVAILGSFSFRAKDVQSAGKPAIQFDNIFYDFGQMKEGDVVEHVFKFKNTGSAPLVIVSVEQPCGCTTPTWSKEPVMPGKTGEVKVVFNSKDHPGVFRKTMQVTTNIGDGKDPLLLVKGNVLLAKEWRKLHNK